MHCAISRLAFFIQEDKLHPCLAEHANIVSSFPGSQRQEPLHFYGVQEVYTYSPSPLHVNVGTSFQGIGIQERARESDQSGASCASLNRAPARMPMSKTKELAK